ncbi:MAG: hypothetical protein RMM53_09940 [Bacteroidia bacterium]|nr:hypothetical protein [Bacteroidia bacterium]MDW8334523.1 hypothetical protein [Bacteroidia bacterium]
MRPYMRLLVHKIPAVALAALALAACKPESSLKMSIEIGGVCEDCPFSRLDTLLQNTKGVIGYSYTDSTQTLQVEIDTSVISRKAFIGRLNDYGYDANESIGIPTTANLYCCDIRMPVEFDSLAIEEEEMMKETEELLKEIGDLDKDIDALEIKQETEEEKLDEDDLFKEAEEKEK